MSLWASILKLFGQKPKLEHIHDITSPDGRVVCHIQLRLGQLQYSVKKDGKVVLRESGLGMKLQGEEPNGHGRMLVRLLEKK